MPAHTFIGDELEVSGGMEGIKEDDNELMHGATRDVENLIQVEHESAHKDPTNAPIPRSSLILLELFLVFKRAALVLGKIRE